MNIRKAKLEDLTNILSIYRESFKTNIPHTYFIWKYLNNPFENYIFIIEKEKEILAFYGVLIFPIANSEKKLSILSDACAHPHAKKFGKKNSPFIILSEYVFNEILNRKDIEFIIGFSGKRHYYLTKIFGWSNVFNKILNFSTNIFDVLNSNFAISGTTKILEKDFDKSIVPFNYNKLLQINKDFKFLKWRYIDYPFQKYNIFNLNNSFIITKISKDTLYIEDLFLPAGEEINLIKILYDIIINFSLKSIKIELKISRNHPLVSWIKYTNLFNEESNNLLYPLNYKKFTNEKINNLIFTSSESFL